MQSGIRTRFCALVRSLLLVPFALLCIPLAAFAADEAPAYRSGEVLVGFLAQNPNAPGAVGPAQAVAGVGQIVARNLDTGVARVQLNRGVTIRQAIATLTGRPGIRYAEPNYLRYTTATPNDTYYATKQYGPQKVRMDLAWDTWQPQTMKVVAIVDTGIDLNHPDLSDVLYRDGSGNVIGYNAIDTSQPPIDDHDHGTHTAGIAAAHINNGTGIAGIAGWNPNVAGSNAYVRVMPVKVLAANGNGDDSQVSAGIHFAVDHGASVISMSLGGPASSTTLSDAVAYATSHDVVVCAAAGNYGVNSLFYPAAYPDVLSIAATDNTDTLASFSNYGTWVKVAAPGVNIYSTLPTYVGAANYGTNYGYLSGTSMATPHVAGEAVMLRSAFPALTLQQVNALIIGNTDTYHPYSGHTIASGGGRINVNKALLSAAAGTGAIISVSMAPNPVTGGTGSTGTVTIGAPAPSGGKVIALSTNNASVTVPASVTIPENGTSANFAVTTQPVASVVDVTITATGDNIMTGTLSVDPPLVANLTMNPASMAGGNPSTATVTIGGPAPTGGTVVTLTSNKAAATVPATVTVSAGATTANFTVTTTAVTVSTNVTITAKTGSTTRTAALTLKTATPSSVSFDPKSVMGGSPTTGTVTLTGPAPTGGLTVTLSSNKAEVTVPANVVVTAGAATASFAVNTANVTANLTASVTATANGMGRAGSLSVLPAMKSVSVSPTSVMGGKPATGTVTLNGPAPAGGIVVTLSTTNGAATIPSSVTVPGGSTMATFPVTTVPVAANTNGTFSGEAMGVTRTSPVFMVKAPSLTGFAFMPSTIAVGQTATGKLTINGAAPSGFTVNLTTGNATVAPVPASITFNAGATTATFTVTGGPTSTTSMVTITAKDPALITKTAVLTVHP